MKRVIVECGPLFEVPELSEALVGNGVDPRFASSKDFIVDGVASQERLQLFRYGTPVRRFGRGRPSGVRVKVEVLAVGDVPVSKRVYEFLGVRPDARKRSVELGGMV